LIGRDYNPEEFKSGDLNNAEYIHDGSTLRTRTTPSDQDYEKNSFL